MQHHLWCSMRRATGNSEEGVSAHACKGAWSPGRILYGTQGVALTVLKTRMMTTCLPLFSLPPLHCDATGCHAVRACWSQMFCEGED